MAGPFAATSGSDRLVADPRPASVQARLGKWVRRLALRNARAWQVVRDTIAGVWSDGFTHAGNIAYLSLLTLFPFFIMLATVAGALGRTDDGLRAVNAFFRTLPRGVAELVAKPITDVMTARAPGGLLTFGVLVTLWTLSGFIETLRSVIRQAYRSPSSVSVWRYRLVSVLIVVLAVTTMLAALAAQVVLAGADSFLTGVMPGADEALAAVRLRQLVPPLALFAALYAVFFVLTPTSFRRRDCPIWPGALLTTATWAGTTMAMPVVLAQFGGYTLTYGSLAGVIVTLLFFYIIGLALVAGANLNAALAKPRQSRLKDTLSAVG